ncbi:hypothetical protein [Virgibacillus necropolis]
MNETYISINKSRLQKMELTEGTTKKTVLATAERMINELKE